MKTKILFVSFILLTACSRQLPEVGDNLVSISRVPPLLQATKNNVYYGPQVEAGTGLIRSFIVANDKGKPVETGAIFTEEAITQQPLNHIPGTPQTDYAEFVLPLHPVAKALVPFKLLHVDWYPEGSHPSPIAFKRHYGVHFFYLTNNERLAIPEWSPGPVDVAYNQVPASGYLPTGFITVPGPGAAIAGQGKHWFPPVNSWPTPASFSTFMVYGTWQGNVAFVEPSVTSEFLGNGTTYQASFAQPMRYTQSGYYPTMFNVYKDTKHNRHIVSLSHFVYHDAQ